MSSDEAQGGINQGYQSVIQKQQRKGHPVIVKKARRRSIPLWRWVEAWILSREARALEILQDVPEVPVLIERPDAWTIVMEFREGTPLSECDTDKLPDQFFLQLGDVVAEIHRRGVVHSDLKKLDNLMVSPDGEPIVLDFGTALFEGGDWRVVNRFLYSQFRQIDNNAVSKITRLYRERLITQEDRENLENPVILEKISRLGRTLLPWRE